MFGLKNKYPGSVTSQQQKNNLVFYGIAPDPLEVHIFI